MHILRSFLGLDRYGTLKPPDWPLWLLATAIALLMQAICAIGRFLAATLVLAEQGARWVLGTWVEADAKSFEVRL